MAAARRILGRKRVSAVAPAAGIGRIRPNTQRCGRTTDVRGLGPMHHGDLYIGSTLKVGGSGHLSLQLFRVPRAPARANATTLATRTSDAH